MFNSVFLINFYEMFNVSFGYASTYLLTTPYFIVWLGAASLPAAVLLVKFSVMILLTIGGFGGAVPTLQATKKVCK